jgi:uncharacterized protein (TIGR02001 family)
MFAMRGLHGEARREEFGVGPLGVRGTMSKLTNIMKTASATGIALLALTGAALADGEYGSVKDAPVEEGRKFTWSITLGATSDYIFRGLSLNDEDPAFQPAINIGYGIFYAGAWGSNITGDGFAPWETDFYAGIKPVWGPVTFDLGAVYYSYLGADDPLDYVELKAGMSFSPFTNLTLTPVFWYTPDQDNYVTTYSIEGTAAYVLPAVGIFTPTVSALVGYTEAPDDAGFFGPSSDYTYWNAGVALAVEKFTFDFRYWDTNLDSVQGDAFYGLDDERFVFSASVTLP